MPLFLSTHALSINRAKRANRKGIFMKYLLAQKSVIFYALLGTLGAPVWALDQAPIILNVDTLKMVDGTPLVDLVEIVKFKAKIRKMLDQRITDRCSFKDLVKLELQLSAADRTVAVQRFITQFEKTAQPYLKDIHVARELINPCINAWAKQRQQPNTLLRVLNTSEFQPGKEHALFVKHITSLKALDQFLEDLHLFLNDFIASLPKSFAKYQAALTKASRSTPGACPPATSK